MSKSLFLSCAITLMAIPAFGAGVASDFLRKENNPYLNGEVKTVAWKGQTYELGESCPDKRIKTRATFRPDIITEAEGREQLYSKESAGTALFNGQIQLYKDDFPAYVVWGENDEVYVKDIISTAANDTYVKGTFKDGVITFATGQVVANVPPDEELQGDMGYDIAVGIIRSEISGNKINFHYDPSFEEFTIKVGDDGKLELVLPGEPFDGENVTEYALGLFYSDDEEFVGFCDFFQSYTPEDFKIVEMPENVETEQYVFIDDFDYASLVEVAFTEDRLYIQGLNPMMPEAVVWAKLDGDKAYIYPNEYVGIYMDMFFIFTRLYTDNPDYNEKDPRSPLYIPASGDAVFTLRFENDRKSIVADTPGIYLMFQPDEEGYDNAILMLSEFALNYQDSPTGTPANPTHLKYLTNWVYYFGYADFQFNISNYSIEGNLLDADHLYYKVLVNGEPIIFEEKEITDLMGEPVVAYTGIVDRQLWVPYLFNNNEDIMKFSNNEFDVGIYVPDVKTLGIQTLYVYDNKYTYSDIVTLDVETGEETATPNGVETLMSANMVKTEYYTLQGIRVEHPSKGIYVKKTFYSDGKVKTDKLLMP